MLNVKCRKCGKRYDDFEFNRCPRCGADNRAPRRDDLGDAGGAARHLIADEFAERELKRSVQETEEVIAKAKRELAEATAKKQREETPRVEDEEKKRASPSTQGGRFGKILAYECLFGIVLIIIGVAINDSGTPLAGALAGTGFLLVTITALGMAYADAASRRKNRERKNGRQRPKIGLLGGALLGLFFIMFVLWYVIMHVEVFKAFREAAQQSNIVTEKQEPYSGLEPDTKTEEKKTPSLTPDAGSEQQETDTAPNDFVYIEPQTFKAKDRSTFDLLYWWREDGTVAVKLDASYGKRNSFRFKLECVDADGNEVVLDEVEAGNDMGFLVLRFSAEESLTPQAFVLEEWDRNAEEAVSTWRAELKPELFTGWK